MLDHEPRRGESIGRAIGVGAAIILSNFELDTLPFWHHSMTLPQAALSLGIFLVNGL